MCRNFIILLLVAVTLACDPGTNFELVETTATGDVVRCRDEWTLLSAYSFVDMLYFSFFIGDSRTEAVDIESAILVVDGFPSIEGYSRVRNGTLSINFVLEAEPDGFREQMLGGEAYPTDKLFLAVDMRCEGNTGTLRYHFKEKR